MSESAADDGFVPLNNTLLDALMRADLTKRQYKVILAVIRKTDGYRKDQDDLSASQLARLTGLNRSNVVRVVNELVALQVLAKQAGRYGQCLGLIKDAGLWQCGYSREPGARDSTAVPKRSPQAYQNNIDRSARLAAKLMPKQQQRCQNDTRPGVKTTAAPVSEQHQHRCQDDTASGVETTPTTNNTQKITSTNNPNRQVGRGGGEDEIIFPGRLDQAERTEARRILAEVASGAGDVQALLDVLAAALQRGTVRNPLALLGGLVRRWREGSFDPAPGFAIAAARRRQARQQRQADQQESTAAVLRRHARMLGVAEEEYLQRFQIDCSAE